MNFQVFIELIRERLDPICLDIIAALAFTAICLSLLLFSLAQLIAFINTS